jgi:hypothetical protein
MITLAEAQDLAFQMVKRTWWKKSWGELMLDHDATFENDDVYTFDYGPREWVLDRNKKYALYGNPLVVVRKSDGSTSLHPAGPPPLSDFNLLFPDLRKVE